MNRLKDVIAWLAMLGLVALLALYGMALTPGPALTLPDIPPEGYYQGARGR